MFVKFEDCPTSAEGHHPLGRPRSGLGFEEERCRRDDLGRRGRNHFHQPGQPFGVMGTGELEVIHVVLCATRKA